jgi:F-type H+-transporting ATPase subunit b
MAPHETVVAGNFLIPNGTFFVEVIAFLIIMFVIARYALPRLNRVMVARQGVVDQQYADADEAREQLAAAQAEYHKAIAEARTQAATIRDNATREAQRTVDEMHAKAEAESARIVARGEELLANQRQSAVRELRAEIGTLAVELASKIIGESLEDEVRRKGTVDRFLADLDAHSGDSADARSGDNAVVAG